MKDNHIKKLIKYNKDNPKFGKDNGSYKDGYFSKDRFCKRCKEKLSNTGRKKLDLCKKCCYKERKVWNKGIKIGRKYNTHHRDGNEDNNFKSNKMRMTASLHMKMHRVAYHYLVKLGLIDKYIKWFYKKGRYESYRH